MANYLSPTNTWKKKNINDLSATSDFSPKTSLNTQTAIRQPNFSIGAYHPKVKSIPESCDDLDKKKRTKNERKKVDACKIHEGRLLELWQAGNLLRFGGRKRERESKTREGPPVELFSLSLSFAVEWSCCYARIAHFRCEKSLRPKKRKRNKVECIFEESRVQFVI